MADHALPLVSIVLPCRNEEHTIEGCVQSILAQKPPRGGFEVIVADGMSNDRTREVVERLAKTDDRIRVISNHLQIVSGGLNLAIQVARGRVIMRMDAHTEYANDYVVQCLATLNRTHADNVGGPCRARGFSLMGRAIAAAFQSPFAVGGSSNHNVAYEGPIDTVYLGCWPKEVFAEVGLFDEQLVRNQDDEFNYRMRKAGKVLWQSPTIRSIYHTRETLGKLFRQYLQYSYWKVKVIRKHQRPASVRHLVPSTFFLTLAGLSLTSIWVPAAGIAAAGIAGVYVASAIGAAVVSASQYEWRLLPLLPVVFMTYHLAYGIGFLTGIWDFFIRRRPARVVHQELTR